MPIYETGETKVRTDCLNFGVSLRIQIKKEAFGLYFCGILDSAAVQAWTKFPSLITNVLLQLVRDIINGVCYQRYEKHLEQQKGRRMLMFSLQKKIGKRKYCIIKSVIDYCLKSNMHTRRGLTIRLKKLKPNFLSLGPPISGFPKFWEQGQFPAYVLATIFAFLFWFCAHFFTMPVTNDLYIRMSAKNWSERRYAFSFYGVEQGWPTCLWLGSTRKFIDISRSTGR